ncbi:helix-turn-helix transcriptional regulator [Micromonospora matsumotoense]|uniref:helix-turn-helix domain-containing protein n=1 Tax=Micromonospora matsumotoense TaxID=121616 RepID=UPI00342D054B
MNDALRAAMVGTGHTIESLADRVGVDRKTVARWVNESRIPHPRHRKVAATVLGRPIGDIWADTSRRREPTWFRPWQEIEREAVALRSYQSVVLPGLLQTEAYAREVLAGSDVIAPGDVERHLASRLARQSILSRDERPPHFTAVIDEAVLRRPVGGRAVMRDQVRALLTVCQAPHIRVHVVPSTVGSYAGLNGPFVLAIGPERRAAGYLDNQLQGQVVTDPDDVAAIMTAWENVRGEALSHWQSTELLTEMVETWT